MAGAPLADVAALLAAESEETFDTIVPPIVWGVGFFLGFMVLLAITLAFGRGRG